MIQPGENSLHAAIDGFLRSLKIERNCSDLTIKSYSEDLNSLLEYFGDYAGGIPGVDQIDVLALRGYVNYLHQCQYARSTMARRLACLRSLFRYCCREGFTTSNPAKALRTPRAGRRLPHFLTTDQVVKLLEAPAANTAPGLRDRAILETLYSAGLRVAELAGLARLARLAGVAPADVDTLYFTGGSTGLAPLVERIAACFPQARRAQGDRFASVARGLGEHARQVFGG